MTVLVLGAGWPALSTAHALTERGFAVTVIEPPGYLNTKEDDCPVVLSTAAGDGTRIWGAVLLNRQAGLSLRQRAAWLSRRWLGQRHPLASLLRQRTGELIRRSRDDLEALGQQLGTGIHRLAYAATMEMSLSGDTGVQNVPVLDGLDRLRMALQRHLVRQGVTFLRRALVGWTRQGPQLHYLTVRSDTGLPETLALQAVVVADWDFARPLAAAQGIAPPLARVSRLRVRFSLPQGHHRRRTLSVRDEVLGMHALRSHDSAWVLGPRCFGRLKRVAPDETGLLLDFARTTLGIERRAEVHHPTVQHLWATPDGLPLMGAPSAISNLYMNLGHDGACAPTLFGTASCLAAHIRQDLDHQRPARF